MKKLLVIVQLIFREAWKDLRDKIRDYNRIYGLDRDLCIRALKYGDDHRDGFTFDELCDHLRLDEVQKEYLLNSIKYGQVFKIHRYVGAENGVEVLKEKLLMTFEDKFRLMEYLELKEAMKSSRAALRVAIFSITIAVIVGVFQIIVEVIALQK